MKTNRISALLMVLIITIVPAFSQKEGSRQKIRSITIIEEKSDVLIKKQVKDSETFYDLQGNIIEEINYKQGKEDKHFRYQYDLDKNKVKEEKIDPSGEVYEYSEYKYEGGLRVEKTVYTGNGKQISKKIYKYTTW